MNETLTDKYMNRRVRYDGDNRGYLRGKVGTIKSVTKNGNTLTFGVAYEDGSFEYGAEWAWELLSEENFTTTAKALDIDEMFTAAAGGKYEIAKHEIERLEARIAELREFIRIHDSL